MSDDKLYYKVSHNPILRTLLRSPVFALAVHWIFQGMLYMDRTELLFKLSLDLSLTIIFWLLLSLLLGLSWGWALLAAFPIAHTVNFLFNGQVWVVLRCFHLISHRRAEFDAYLARLSSRIQSEPSIRWAAAYGSLVREQWHPSSDLDVRMVREPGIHNGLRACCFTMGERTRALFCGFPLDVFLLDGPSKLARMRDDERPAQIKPSSQ